MFNKPFRIHFSSIIEDFFKTFWIILVLVVTNFIQAINEINFETVDMGKILISSFAGVGIVCVIILMLYIRWRKTYITLNKEVLIIERKLLVNKHSTIGLKNVSNVDFEQNIFEKIIGTAKLKLDTNSLSTANENDVKIILKTDDIIILKEEIMKYVNLLNNVNQEIKTDEFIEKEKLIKEDDTDSIKYGFDKVLMHSILSVPIISFVIFLIWVIVITLSASVEETTEFNNISNKLIIMIIFIIPIILGTVNNIFRLYGFKAKRIDNNIHLSYGLFTTKKFTIPVDKINAVIVKQPTLARIVKKYTVEIANVGMTDDVKIAPVLLLVGTKAEIIGLMEKLLPEVKINVEEEKQPKVALIPITLHTALWGMFLIIPTIVFIQSVFKVYVLVGLVIFLIISAYLNYRTRKLSFINQKLYITQGIFIKKTSIIDIKKVQLIRLKNSIVTKKLKIQKMNVQILASHINLQHQSGYFENEKFEKILEQYK